MSSRGLARLLRQGSRVWYVEPAHERFRGWMRTSDAHPPFQEECSSQTPKVLPLSRAAYTTVLHDRKTKYCHWTQIQLKNKEKVHCKDRKISLLDGVISPVWSRKEMAMMEEKDKHWPNSSKLLWSLKSWHTRRVVLANLHLGESSPQPHLKGLTTKTIHESLLHWICGHKVHQTDVFFIDKCQYYP